MFALPSAADTLLRNDFSAIYLPIGAYPRPDGIPHAFNDERSLLEDELPSRRLRHLSRVAPDTGLSTSTSIFAFAFISNSMLTVNIYIRRCDNDKVALRAIPLPQVLPRFLSHAHRHDPLRRHVLPHLGCAARTLPATVPRIPKASSDAYRGPHHRCRQWRRRTDSILPIRGRSATDAGGRANAPRPVDALE